MENRAERRGKRSNEPGPWGRRAAQNLEDLRERSRLSQKDLAAAAERLGRPMTMQIVSKTEAGERRIDADDLAVFALVLRATPNRLLLTRTAHADQAIEVAPGYQVPELDAWMWGLGERPLDRGFDAPKLQTTIDSDRERWFAQDNRPNHPPDSPLGNPLQAHPEVAKAIMNLARQARRAGLGVQPLHYTLDYAYLMASAEDED